MALTTGHEVILRAAVEDDEILGPLVFYDARAGTLDGTPAGKPALDVWMLVDVLVGGTSNQ